jgi:hypothetical protein
MTQPGGEAERDGVTRTPLSRLKRAGWLLAAMAAATVPVAGVFSLSNVFYIRDLSLAFWPRYLWLRRSLIGGEWPLWDPYLAAGQSAVADGLHQMFLLPVLLLRLVGTEVMGFNLWVAMPFPLAAAGAYLFFRHRSSAPAASLGAVAFAVSGPVVSTGNFPNMSWAVAAVPWTLWAVDQCLQAPTQRRTALVALVVGFEALAGEPVTLAATLVLVTAYAIVFGAPGRDRSWPVGIRAWSAIAAGLVIGVAMSAVQFLPMAHAVSGSWRSANLNTSFWSLHPLTLVETLFIHLFGNFFDASIIEHVPWMRALNSGREPFFYSIYTGPTVLALATFGLAAGERRWTAFWTASGVVALFAAFGVYTPFYRLVLAHLPLVQSFRFPAKYLVITALSLAAFIATAWDTITSDEWGETCAARWSSARALGMAVPAFILAACYVMALGVFYAPMATNRWLMDIAWTVGISDLPAAASYMRPRLIDAIIPVAVLSAAAAAFLFLATSRRPERHLARHALFIVLVADLVVAAIGINPTLDRAWLSESPWMRTVRAHPESRYYFGGEQEGIFDIRDPDAPQFFVPPVDLNPAEARASVANESVLYPAPYGVRAVFSYDLAVLWPRVVQSTHRRFLRSKREDRDRFLDRTAVRYRILPPPQAAGHAPLARLRHFDTASLYDWGPGLERAFVVPDVLIIPDLRSQLNAMFGPGLDVRKTVLTAVAPSRVVGRAGAPAEASARIVEESNNRVLVDASAGANGGYLVLLDSYSADWQASVDGIDATVYEANVLYRTVPLPPGRHTVAFRYRPWSFEVGLACSLVSALVVLWLALPQKRRA